MFILAFLLEVSIRCRDATTAEALLPRLSSLGNRLQTWYHPTSFGRLLGEAAAMLGQVEAARAYLLQALEVDRKVRFRPDLALTRLDLAELLVEHFPDQRAEAVDLLQLAIAEFADMGMQPSLERALQVQRTAAGATAGSPTPTLDSEVDALTAREREVASLIGRGLSNRDIAAALVITEMTTETHVKHILAKLGFRSRSQVAVWATHHGLAHEAGLVDALSEICGVFTNAHDEGRLDLMQPFESQKVHAWAGGHAALVHGSSLCVKDRRGGSMRKRMGSLSALALESPPISQAELIAYATVLDAAAPRNSTFVTVARRRTNP